MLNVAENKKWQDTLKKFNGKKTRMGTLVREMGFKPRDAKEGVGFQLNASDILEGVCNSMNDCAGVKSLHRIYGAKLKWCIIGPKFAHIVWTDKPKIAYRYAVPSRFYLWKAHFDLFSSKLISDIGRADLKRALAADIRNGKSKFILMPPTKSTTAAYQKKVDARRKRRLRRAIQAGKNGKLNWEGGPHSTLTPHEVKFTAGAGKEKGKTKRFQALRHVTFH